ncbi:hypothetical protein GALMADRAFT_239860 [Galerina marginata CBS 339.88]|uniref:2',3'-cyclic-nucleotide 3'-phosphodiesterase n=1 Tax=Galerina marginata (strain CBS 339.88) TaxID=685588 RepID=A0A067TH76_GALM3|nr:hypothetical protein GALMADRAFT_239860 [Galerina marginata CBS 339.88]
MGLSLWIVPDEKDAVKLEHLMRLCQNDPSISLTSASYPNFYPHITLASFPLSMGNDLDSIGFCIQKSGAPVRCTFASVDIGTHYFRSVYVAIKVTPDLVSLHERVHKELGTEPRTPAFPHMSLCYIGDIDAAAGERERYHEELKKNGKIKMTSQDEDEKTVCLNCGSSGTIDWMDNFEAHEVWAVRCEGPVEGWAILRKFSLTKI